MTTNDTNQDVDGLAQVLAEHGDYAPDDDSSGDVCAGCFVKLDPDGDSHAGSLAGLHKHQAAVVLAHLKEQGTMSVWRFTYQATGRTVERTTIQWERDL